MYNIDVKFSHDLTYQQSLQELSSSWDGRPWPQ